METKSIEEIAKKCANEWRADESFCPLEYHIEKALVEQDRIAREEDREKCIRKAVEWLKENRWNYDQTSDYQFGDMLKELRKAMDVYEI